MRLSSANMAEAGGRAIERKLTPSWKPAAAVIKPLFAGASFTKILWRATTLVSDCAFSRLAATVSSDITETVRAKAEPVQQSRKPMPCWPCPPPTMRLPHCRANRQSTASARRLLCQQARRSRSLYFVCKTFLIASLDNWTTSSLRRLISSRRDCNSSDWE